MTKHKFDLLINGIWALPLLLILKIISFLLILKLLKYDLIEWGILELMLVSNMFMFNLSEKNIIIFFVLTKIIVNYHWASMIRRKLIVNKLFYYLFKYNTFFF